MRRSLALTLVAAVVVAACGDSGDDAASDTTDPSTTSTTTDAAASASDATTTTPTTAATTTPPTSSTTTTSTTTVSTTTSTTTTTVAPAGPECLVGPWVVTEEQMNVFYDALEAEMDAPAELDVTGRAVLELGPDTYEWRPEFVLQLTVVGQVGSGDTSGSITGEYTTADGIITTVSEVNDIEIVVDVGGQTFDGSDLGNAMLNSAPINDAPYECGDGTLTLGFATGGPDRVPIALVPA